MKKITVLLAISLSFLAACGAEAESHPHQETDFGKITSAADVSVSSSETAILESASEISSENELLTDSSYSSVPVVSDRSAVSDNADEYSDEKLRDICNEIMNQPFFNDDIIRHIEIKGGKVEITVEDKTVLNGFLSDKPYREAVLVIEQSERPVSKWLADLESELNITDWQLYDKTLRKLKNHLTGELDSADYGGIAFKNSSFSDPETGEIYLKQTGIIIFAENQDVIKSITERLLQETDSSAGIIEIEYLSCSYSIAELEKIEQIILRQPFFNEDGHWTVAFGGGKLVIDMDSESCRLEEFLAEKHWADAVKIRLRSEVNPVV